MSLVLTQPVFSHAWFRSGSTWFWSKLRGASDICAYYEPLNEELGILTPGKILQGPTKAFEGDNHPPMDRHYFHEYLAVIESGRLKFEPGLSYERYYLPPGDEDPALAGYLGNLLQWALASGTRPALCFCRSQMRALWMKRKFGGLHIGQFRGAADQWVSFGKHPYFKHRLLLTAFFLQRRHPGCLSHIHGFDEMHRVWQSGQSFRYLESVCLEVFVTLWLASGLQTLAASDIILDIDRLGTDLALRAETAEILRSAGLPHDLDDCKPPAARHGAELLSAVSQTMQRSASWLALNPVPPLVAPGINTASLAANLARLSDTNAAALRAALG